MMRWLPLGLLFSNSLLAADAVQETIGVKTSPLGSESLFQTVGGLLLILLLILGGAWLFKRYGSLSLGGKGLVRILGGVSVGTRERVVLVEVENTRLLLGVAPGQVRTLHCLSSEGASFSQALDLAARERKPDGEGER